MTLYILKEFEQSFFEGQLPPAKDGLDATKRSWV
jgi:hypothetical protein